MRYFIVIFLSLFLLASNSLAAWVRVSGYGETREEAIIDAKKNAVAKSSGEYIDSKVVLSDDFLSTKTLSVTNGIVVEYKIFDDYDPTKKKVTIEAIVQNDKFSGVKDESQRIIIKGELLDDLMKQDQQHMAAIYDLFSNPSEIYDVNVKSVDVSVKGGFYCYDLEIELKRNKLWKKKYDLLVDKIGDVFDREFTGSVVSSDQKRKPGVLLKEAKFVDKENDVSIDVGYEFFDHSSGQFFYLGQKTSWLGGNQYSAFCSKNKISSFNFKFVLLRDIFREKHF